MRTVKVELRTPIWRGGTPHVGIAEYRATGADMLEVTITYRRKDGIKSFPDTYTVLTKDLQNFPTQRVKGGVTLRVIPLSSMMIK